MSYLIPLPPELLDLVIEHLAEVDAKPGRRNKDYHNVSLTCWRLREAVLPFLFRDVPLGLRWHDGVLVEPSLYKIRSHPHLWRHVRRVHITTESHTSFDYEDETDERPVKGRKFVIPGAKDWPCMIDSDLQWSEDDRIQLLGKIRQIVASLATPGTHISSAVETFEQSIGSSILSISRYWIPRTGEKAHALAIDTISFESRNKDIPHDDQPSRFALLVLAFVMLLHGGRLRGFNMASLRIFLPQRRLSARLLDMHPPNSGEDGGAEEILTDAVIDCLNVSVLSLRSPVRHSHVDINHGQLFRWTRLGHSVCDLTLDRHRGTYDNLVAFIQSFSLLKKLRLRHCAIYMTGWQARVVTHTDLVRFWLNIAIELRNTYPEAQLTLEDLSVGNDSSALYPGAMKWLSLAASARGEIDMIRQDRLLEDFESFQGLWAAEATIGEDAIRAGFNGMLVDEAMSRRSGC